MAAAARRVVECLRQIFPTLTQAEFELGTGEVSG
jgi:hypothetical protein